MGNTLSLYGHLLFRHAFDPQNPGINFRFSPVILHSHQLTILGIQD